MGRKERALFRMSLENSVAGGPPGAGVTTLPADLSLTLSLKHLGTVRIKI